MRHWLRKLRGALAIATGWGIAGAILGLLVGLGSVVLGGLSLAPWLHLSAGSGACGAVLGCGFSLTLMTLENGRSADDLTPARAATCGGLAGAVLSLLAIGSTAIPAFGLGVLHPKLLIAAGIFAGASSVFGATFGALTMSLASSEAEAPGLRSAGDGRPAASRLETVQAEPIGDLLSRAVAAI